MIVTLSSTDKIVELVVNGRAVPARVWEGHTSSGIPCHAFITRIAVDPEQDSAEFERELRQCQPATPAIAAIPLRLIL